MQWFLQYKKYWNSSFKKIKNFLRSQEYLICFSFDINEIDLFHGSRSFSVKERKKRARYENKTFIVSRPVTFG